MKHGALEGLKSSSCVGDESLQGGQNLNATDGSGFKTSFTLTLQSADVLSGKQSSTEFVEGQALPFDAVTLMCRRDRRYFFSTL